MTESRPESVVLSIRGMDCAGCVRKVTVALKNIEGVADAKVSLASRRAVVSGRARPDALIAGLRDAGYEASIGDDLGIAERIRRRRAERLETLAYWKKKLYATILAIPVIVLGMSGVHSHTGDLVQFALGTVCLLLLAPPFYRQGLPDLLHLRFRMDSLISLGSLTAYLTSLHGLYSGGHVYFEDAVAILGFLTVGRYLEARGRIWAGESIDSLIDLIPREATILRDGQEERIDARLIAEGDLVVVRPGEKVPVDGSVTEGDAECGEAVLTGEAAPVAKHPGSRVIAGATVHGGRLVVRAESVGEGTTLAEILREMERAADGRTRYRDLADRAVAVFMPIVLAIAAATLVGWWIHGGDFLAALRPTVAVMIIACPCALGIAIPIAVTVGAGIASLRGVLIREPSALDRISELRLIIFDKTGSVTHGRFRLVGIRAAGIGDSEAMELAAAVEAASEHLLGRALLAEVKAPRPVTAFSSDAGLGVSGRVGEWEVRVGRLEWLALDAGDWVRRESDAGRSVFGARYRSGDREAHAVFAVEDEVRADAAEVLRALRARGYRVVLVSGDRLETVRAVAERLGFDEYRAGVSPREKAALVKEYRAKMGCIAMVGDGVNDGPALAEADLAIAMGGGTALAIEAGSAVLVRDDLAAILDLLTIGDAIRRKSRENLFWAFLYNSILIPAAAFGVAPPMAAAIAMALSDVTVVLNTLRLWRLRWGQALTT
jgi:P-type Cu+ transporter